jgi:ATP-dependent DNA helicase RecG
VGAGIGKSVCLLLRGDSLSEVARERLALMRETQDGFRLAEEDLRLRGGGELLGTRQSGDTPFRVASLDQITKLLPIAHDDARLLMERDGGLVGERAMPRACCSISSSATGVCSFCAAGNPILSV